MLRRTVCSAARGQTLRLPELIRKQREHKEDGELCSIGLTDQLLMWVAQKRTRQRKYNNKKTTFDAGNVNLTEDLLGFRQLLI